MEKGKIFMKRIAIMLFILLTFVLVLASCGHDCEYTIDASLSKAPTCTEDGYNVSKCGECDEQQLVPVPKLGHDYVTSDPVAPTCQSEGYTEKVCSRCQDKQVFDKVPMTEHNYVPDPEHNKAPTCTEKGYEALKCSTPGCDATRRTNQTDALGHDWEKVAEGENGQTPTCREACVVWEYEKCKVCGTEKDAAAKVRHAYAKGEYPHDFARDDAHIYDSKTATCQTEGYIIWYCLECQIYTERQKTEDIKECDFSQTGTMIAEETCYSLRKELRTCAFKDHTVNNTKEVEVDGTRLAHTPNVSVADCATDKYCKVCFEHFGSDAGYYDECPNPTDDKCNYCPFEGKVHLFAKSTGAHSGDRDPDKTVAATCMQTGKYVRVCANMIEDGSKTCGYCYTLEEDIIPIDADAHKYGDAFDKEGNEDKITGATCVTYAYKSKTCENCDTEGTRCDEQIKVELPELGYAPHTFTNVEHAGTIVCENANCKLALYDSTYSKDVIYDTENGTTEDFGDGSSLTVTITGTKTETDGEGNPVDTHTVLNKANPTATVTATAGANDVNNDITVIYIEKTGDITVTVKVNGTTYEVDANGYVHLNAEEIDVTSIEITASTDSDTASAKIYYYSRTIINATDLNP